MREQMCSHTRCTGCDVGRLKYVHFLKQASRQVRFGWHEDAFDLQLSPSMISVIICLRGNGTGMQVWGFPVFQYCGVGAAAAFTGGATHRSVYRVAGASQEDEDVLKVALFFD